MTNSERPGTGTVTGERADLIESLRRHRDFLRFTVQGITDEQARRRTTVSELTLGGLIKHVADTERSWADFIVDGPAPAPDVDWASVDWSNPPPEVAAWADGHRMTEAETLEDLLARYAEVAVRTDELVALAARPRRRPAAAGGAVVRAREGLERAAHGPAHHRRDRPARRARGHHPRGARRSEDHGLIRRSARAGAAPKK